jgi:TonB family protein
MRLNRNIMFSLVMHASLLLAAMTSVVGRNAAPDLHEEHVSVTLFEDSVAVKSAEPPGEKRRAGADAGAPSPGHRLEKPSGALVSIHATKEIVASAVSEDKGPEASPISPSGEIPGSGNMKAALDKGKEGSSAGAMSLSLSSVTEHGSGSGQKKIRAGDGVAALSGVIRRAIQRALIYPAAARRRGIEGTVVAEFRINGEGLPQGVRITKSSGHGLLDKAAIETIVRAAPLPPVEEKIEVPITFRLTRADY